MLEKFRRLRRMKKQLRRAPPSNPEFYDMWLESIGDAWADFKAERATLPWYFRLFV